MERNLKTTEHRIIELMETAKQDLDNVIGDQLRHDEFKDAKRKLRLLKGSRVPLRFESEAIETFDDYCEELARAKNKAANVIREMPHKFPTGILFCGDFGVGKTHLAIAIIKAAIVWHGLACRYATAREIIRAIRATWSLKGWGEVEAYTGWVSWRVLVIDEVDRIDGDGGLKILEEIINRRWGARRGTILVSNQTAGELEAVIGGRVLDRIAQDKQLVAIDGVKSYRTNKPEKTAG